MLDARPGRLLTPLMLDLLTRPIDFSELTMSMVTVIGSTPRNRCDKGRHLADTFDIHIPGYHSIRQTIYADVNDD
ncbi:hypothetical protein CS8_092170 [Cupriavidus sp. 8B]